MVREGKKNRKRKKPNKQTNKQKQKQKQNTASLIAVANTPLIGKIISTK